MRIFCSICKEVFIPYSEVKITSCGHLYHGNCISRWVEQHRTCPQCRSTLSSQPFKVYFDVEKDNDSDLGTLQYQVETLTDKLRESELANKALKSEKETCEIVMNGMKECAFSWKQKNDALKTAVKTLKEQVVQMLKQTKQMENLQAEAEMWKNEAQMLQNVNKLINASSGDINEMLESTPCTEKGLKQLCTFISVLKVQLEKLQVKNITLTKENKELLRKVVSEKKKYLDQSEELLNLKADHKSLIKSIEKKEVVNKPLEKPPPIKNSQTPEKKTIQVNQSKCSFDINLDSIFEEEQTHKSKSKIVNLADSINHWESLVCAGPSRNSGRALTKFKSLSNDSSLSKNKNELTRCSNYAFDGMGGRKKIRLGGPTPRDEFEKIKKSNNKKSPPVVTHRKIIEYCTLE